MPLPLIGLTTYRSASAAGYPQISLSEAYIQAVVQSGGSPVLVPLGLGAADLQALYGHLSGLLFTGGGDIEPERYGGSPHPEVFGVDADRDRTELDLLEKAVGDGKPFLGICRGCQVVNVGLGGTLYTHIADQLAGAIKHDYFTDQPREHLAHPVRLVAGSRLHAIIGASEVQVNSLHHQGVHRLAPGLCAVAQAPDGLVEGLELPDHPFGLAVQWHPENLTAHPPMKALFGALIAAAESWQARCD
jgi:putative glutamine amidotransferase